jgi:hypothetical protein
MNKISNFEHFLLKIKQEQETREREVYNQYSCLCQAFPYCYQKYYKLNSNYVAIDYLVFLLPVHPCISN